MARPKRDIDDILFVYGIHVESVYDADTITVTVDAGWSWKWEGQKVRLWGINAPEVRGPERPKGIRSRDYLRDLILDKECVMRSYLDRKGRYGRALGIIYVETDDGWLCVNKELVRRRLARRNTYGDKFTGWPRPPFD